MPQVVEEFAFDAALFKGMLDTGEQAAREMGQWMDKHEVSGTGKGRAIPVIVLPAIVPGKPMQEIEPHMKTTWFGLPA